MNDVFFIIMPVHVRVECQKLHVLYSVRCNKQLSRYLTDGAVIALLASEVDPTSGKTGWKA